MPKIIQNYQIQALLTINSDQIELYSAKQIGSNKKYIMKRLKVNINQNPEQNLNSYNLLQHNDKYYRLLNQTKILKNLQSQRIPKCVRILKTNNSLYVVYQDYPMQTLQEYMKNNKILFNFKFDIVRSVMQTLEYLHSRKVILKGLKTTNLSMDDQGNVYFNNFMNAEFVGNGEEYRKQASSQKAKQSNNKNICDAGLLISQIFEFQNFNSHLQVFTNNYQKQLYEIVSSILSNKITSQTLSKLTTLLNEKRSLRETQCTDSPSSPISPELLLKSQQYRINEFLLNNSKQNKISLTKTSLSVQRNITTTSNKNNSNSKSITKLSLLQSLHLRKVQKQSMRQLGSSQSIQGKAQSSKKEKVYQQSSKQMEIQQKQKECDVKSLIENRKIIHFLLYCVSILDKYVNNRLMHLFLLKCERITQRNLKQIGIKLLIVNKFEFTHGKERKTLQFFSILRQETQSSIKLIKNLQQSLKSSVDIVANQENNQKFYKNAQNTLIQSPDTIFQQLLSRQIYQFLKLIVTTKYSQYLSLFKQNSPDKNIALSMNLVQSKISKKSPLKRTNTLEIQNNLKQTQQKKYSQIKFLYFLSIKLKYSTFEKFFQKKLQNDPTKLNFLQDEYFEPFQQCAISAKNLLEEIIFRVKRYLKKSLVEKTN